MKKIPALCVSALLLVATACGSDGDDAADDAPRDETTTTTADGADTAAVESTEGTGAEGATTGSPVAADGAMCEAFARVRTLDDEIQGKVNDVIGPIFADPTNVTEEDVAQLGEKVQRLVGEIDRAEVASIYDDLVDTVPADRQAAVQTLHEGTVAILDAFAAIDLNNIEGLAASFQQEAILQSAAATMTLDELSRAECDIVIAD